MSLLGSIDTAKVCYLLAAILFIVCAVVSGID